MANEDKSTSALCLEIYYSERVRRLLAKSITDNEMNAVFDAVISTAKRAAPSETIPSDDPAWMIRKIVAADMGLTLDKALDSIRFTR